jgi:hypothetical protein
VPRYSWVSRNCVTEISGNVVRLKVIDEEDDSWQWGVGENEKEGK